MATDHHHSHDSHQSTRAIQLTLGLVFLYFLAELIGGWWTGSLALLADAGHMFSDLAALGLSLWAAWLSRRSAAGQRTFGYYRVEILAALVNGSTLFLVAGGILHEAWERIHAPEPIQGAAMLAIAVGGLVVNLLSLRILHDHRGHNLNLRGAWLHVLGDTLGSVGVIVAATLVWGLGWTLADPIASALVCLLVAFSAWQLVSDAARVLMEFAPPEVDVGDVRERLLSVAGVREVHCLHVWTIASGLRAVSAHVIVDDESLLATALPQLQGTLRDEFPLEHITLQIEPANGSVCRETGEGACLVETTRPGQCRH